MKTPLLTLIPIILPLSLGGCGGGAQHPTTAVVHVAPSTKPVARHIEAASAKVVIVQKDIDDATVAINKLAENEAVKQVADEEVQIIQKGLIKITAELRDTQDELAAATTENATLQKAIDTANDKFNAVEREKAGLTDQVKSLESENRSLSASLRWEKIKGWLKFGTVIGIGVGLLVLAFIFKVVGWGAKVAPLAGL